jgi:hypothetical protein
MGNSPALPTEQRPTVVSVFPTKRNVWPSAATFENYIAQKDARLDQIDRQLRFLSSTDTLRFCVV